jgi:hypothetical protein
MWPTQQKPVPDFLYLHGREEMASGCGCLGLAGSQMAAPIIPATKQYKNIWGFLFHILAFLARFSVGVSNSANMHIAPQHYSVLVVCGNE